jgi:hypothetical protein
LDYILEPAKAAQTEEVSYVVFCVDTSGSMCVTQECPRDFKLKVKKDDLSQFRDDQSDQHLPRERRNVSYISRLQCVQAAVDAQIEELNKLYPNRRVVLVSFNNEVTVWDASGAHNVSGDKLNNFELLRDISSLFNADLDLPLSETRKRLSDQVFALEEGGATALGPALLISLSIASQVRGSQVILCTDGKANVGVGSLEDEQDTQFYENVSDLAIESGVMVNVLTIKGTDAVLEVLANMAVKTKGLNDIVDPFDMSKNFSTILQNPVIATHVQVEMRLHSGLAFRNDDGAKESGMTAVREIGNATRESSITFDYSVKSLDEIQNQPKLPFQLVVRFTRLDGSKCVRVITQIKEITSDRDVAAEDLDVAVIGLHSGQQAAKLAKEGNYTKARMVQTSAYRMAKRNVKQQGNDKAKKQLKQWKEQAKKLDTALHSAKRQESADVALYHSDEEDLSDSEGEEVEKKQSKLKNKMERVRFRSAARTKADVVSNAMYQASNPLYKDYE